MKSLPLLLSVFTVAALGCASGRAPGAIEDEPVDAAPPDRLALDAATDAGTSDAPPTDARNPDAAALDAASPDASPADAPGPLTGTTLLLSEIVLAPNSGELIEIVNVTGAAVDLSTYYLSDAPEYWRLPAGIPSVDSSDVIARFPAGATIPAGGVITVALDTGANFTTHYGIAPTFSIGSATLVVVTPGGTPTLTNVGEPIVLFRWDGHGDRVTDVDLMLAGVPAISNQLADKSGVSQDGPDVGSTASAYASDARTIGPQVAAPASGQSTKRMAPESAVVEIQVGGNGVGGQDETSEATATTWDTTFTAPTPGIASAELIR